MHHQMNILVLNSGSNGNAVFVESKRSGAAVLLDCGISRTQIEKRLQVHGRSATQVRAVCITHEHSDHVRGLPVFIKLYRTPVFLTTKTYHSILKSNEITGHHFIGHHEELTVKDISIHAFPKSHDAADPVFYLIVINGKRFLYVTDLGEANEHVLSLLPTVDALLLESNYDDEMLCKGSYPPELKARIDSNVGHLSNAQALDIVEGHCNGKLRVLILGHVSKNNNTPEIVLHSFQQLLERNTGFSPSLHVASRYTVGEVISV